MLQIEDKVKILCVTHTSSGAIIPPNTLEGVITKVNGTMSTVYFEDYGVGGLYSERELELIGEENV
jgi:hypothetical protein